MNLISLPKTASLGLILPFLLTSCGEAPSSGVIRKRKIEVMELEPVRAALATKEKELNAEAKALAPFAKAALNVQKRDQLAANLEAKQALVKGMEDQLAPIREISAKQENFRK